MLHKIEIEKSVLTEKRNRKDKLMTKREREKERKREREKERKREREKERKREREKEKMQWNAVYGHNTA